MSSGNTCARVWGRRAALAAAVTVSLCAAGTSRGAGTDGFTDIASNAPDTVLTPVSGVGVTHGTQALRVEVPQGSGAFWGFETPNVVDTLKGGATTLSYDMTLIGQELNGGSFGGGADTSFNGFAQSNELAVVVAAPSGGFIQKSFSAGGGTDSLNQNAQWNGVDGTRHITWDLTKFTSGSSSLADFITANNANDAHIWFVTQGGDSNGTTGPMRFYFDNVALSGPGGSTIIGDFESVPEPGTAALLALGLPMLALRRRRTR